MMGTRPLNILYVSSHWPGAPSYGTQQRVLHLGRLLKAIGHVNLAIVSPDPVSQETVERTRAEFDVVCTIRPELRSRGWLGRLRHELDARYLATDAYAATDEDSRAMAALISEHDVVWVQTIKTANRLRIARWPSSVLDIDDFPSSLYHSAAARSESLWPRLVNARMEAIWKRRERVLAERFDVLVVCSEEDKRRIPSDRVEIVPNGFTAPTRESQRLPGHPLRLGFIGNFQWAANTDGIEWFIAQIWPSIRHQMPEVRLRLVGSGSERYSSGRDGIDGIGWIEDAAPEVASWSAMVIPIRIGAGTRIKLAEAFARKCPVVSTSLGAYGYEVRDREHLLIADTAHDFAQACLRLMAYPEQGVQMSALAHDLFLKRWTWDSYQNRVKRAVQRALAASDRSVLVRSHPSLANQ